jgi:nucleoid DNA-binding protein
MGKISIQDLAQVLVERKGLNKRDAVIFVSAMFDIIQTNLEKDRVVKVKGLGTFKIIDVDDRESVNVNTGERVLIEGHNKITFTPDALMKELVNKPFSQFETVVLNDGVDFDDTTEEDDPNDPANMPLVDFGAVEEHKLIDIADEDIPEWVIEPVVKKPKRPAETKPVPVYEPEPESIDDEPFVEPEPMIEEPEPEPFVEPKSMVEEPEPEPFVEPDPFVEPVPEHIFEPAPEPIIEEPAPEPAPIVEPKHVVESKYIVEVEPEVGAEPVIEDDLVAEPEPQSFVELEPEPDLETEPVYEPTPIVKPTMIVEPEPAPVPKVEPKVEPIVEPKVEPIYEPEPEPVVEPEPIVEPKPAPVVEPEPEPEEDESEEEYEDEELDEEEEIEEPSSNGGHKWLIALLTCLLGLAGGYVLGNLFPWSQFSQSQDVKVEKAVPASDLESVAEPIDSVVPADTITPAPVAVPEEKPAEAKPVEQPAAKPAEPKPAPATKPVEPKPAVKPAEPKPAPAAKPVEKTEPVAQLDKYQKMDNRVKFGAYKIVGTALEVKVKEGDNLKKIANRILGPDMECYLEVYNGMNSNTQLKVGQTIKIPKLEWKKKKSQKNN